MKIEPRENFPLYVIICIHNLQTKICSVATLASTNPLGIYIGDRNLYQNKISPMQYKDYYRFYCNMGQKFMENKIKFTQNIFLQAKISG